MTPTPCRASQWGARRQPTVSIGAPPTAAEAPAGSAPTSTGGESLDRNRVHRAR
jgi:hypothetical protein